MTPFFAAVCRPVLESGPCPVGQIRSGLSVSTSCQKITRRVCCTAAKKRSTQRVLSGADLQPTKMCICVNAHTTEQQILTLMTLIPSSHVSDIISINEVIKVLHQQQRQNMNLSITMPFLKQMTAGRTWIFSLSTKNLALTTLILANFVSKCRDANVCKQFTNNKENK